MKIISKNTKEANIDIDGWMSRDLNIISIDNFNANIVDVSFKRNSSSLSLDWKQPTIKSQQHNNALIVNIPFCHAYCHNIIDLLPELIWLDQHSSFDLILAPEHAVTQEIVKTFDLHFNKVKFVRDCYTLQAREIGWYQYDINSRRAHKIHELKRQFNKSFEYNNKCVKMIYCTRNNSTATNMRHMNQRVEDEIIELSKLYAIDNRLEFVIYTGLNDDESVMSVADQARLFNEARVVIGPHGGAMVNIIHMLPDNNCIVCEFTSGVDTAVQGVSSFGKNYNRLLGGAPDQWLNYHLIPFTDDSNKQCTSISIDNYKTFLNCM